MPDLFDPVRALYGEARPDGTVPSHDDLSPAARAEMEALAPVKAALDAQPSQVPDAAVLAAVLEAARVPTAPANPRAVDRAPVRSARSRRTRIALPVMALFVCGAIGLSVFLAQPAVDATSDAVAGGGEAVAAAPDAAAPDADAEPVLGTTSAAVQDAVAQERVAGAAAEVSPAAAPVAVSAPPVAASRAPAVQSDDAPADAAEPAGVPEGAAFAAAAQATPSPNRARVPAPGVRMQVPVSRQPGVALVAAEPSAWDAGDEDLRLLSLRLQTLRESNEGLAWDEPPVALSGGAALQSRALDLTSDTVHEETRVGFHAFPQRTGRIHVQRGGQ